MDRAIDLPRPHHEPDRINHLVDEDAHRVNRNPNHSSSSAASEHPHSIQSGRNAPMASATLAWSVNFSIPCLKVSTEFSVPSRVFPAPAV
jgi:hypothetical protein